MSSRQAQRAVHSLLGRGFISREKIPNQRGGFARNQYRLTWPKAGTADGQSIDGESVDSELVGMDSESQWLSTGGPEPMDSRSIEVRPNEQDPIKVPKGGTDSDAGAPSLSPEESYQTLVDLWNEVCDGVFPKVNTLTQKRSRHLAQRIKEHGADRAYWHRVLLRMRDSAFLCGDNERSWRASLDWLICGPDNLVKLLEGHYDNRTSSGRQRPKRQARDPWKH